MEANLQIAASDALPTSARTQSRGSAAQLLALESLRGERNSKLSETHSMDSNANGNSPFKVSVTWNNKQQLAKPSTAEDVEVMSEVQRRDENNLRVNDLRNAEWFDPFDSKHCEDEFGENCQSEDSEESEESEENEDGSEHASVHEWALRFRALHSERLKKLQRDSA